MQLDTPPIFARLAPAKSILIAGAGGGFDIFAGLPLYFALRARGHEVHLANLSFSALRDLDEEVGMSRITADSKGPPHYWPEGYLCRWFREVRNEELEIHALVKAGVKPVRAAYEKLVRITGAEAIVLADGGTDSLMCGVESGLGTPAEDMASIGAVAGLAPELAPIRLLISVGFGVDKFHGVAHAEVLEAIAAIDKAGGYLGALSLLRGMPEVEAYREACEYVCGQPAQVESIVNLSILSAIDGEFGDHHRSERTIRSGSKLFINPLMSMMFAFELAPLAARVRYLPLIENTNTAWEILSIIEGYRRSISIPPIPNIPL